MRIAGMILAVLAVFFLIWLGSSYIWWQGNHEDVEKRMKLAEEEGRTIGRDETDRECLSAFLGIISDCDDMGCALENKTFLKACLQQSRPTADFCEKVPVKTSLIGQARWAANYCIAQKRETSACALGMQEVSLYCQQVQP